MCTKYPKNYFLVFLGLPSSDNKFIHYRRFQGHPIYWERIARKIYKCSLCGQAILKGERYIGCKRLIPGFRGIYGWRGTYVYTYYHISCLLRSEETKLKYELNGLTSQLKRLKIECNEILKKSKLLKPFKTEFKKRSSMVGLDELTQVQTYDNNKLLKALCPEVIENEAQIKSLQQQIRSINMKNNIIKEKIEFLRRQIAKACIEKEKSSFWRKLGITIRYHLIRYRISRGISSAESQIRNLTKQRAEIEREIVFAIKSSEQHLVENINKLEADKINCQQRINILRARISYLESILGELRKLLDETRRDQNQAMQRKSLRKWRLPNEI